MRRGAAQRQIHPRRKPRRAARGGMRISNNDQMLILGNKFILKNSRLKALRTMPETATKMQQNSETIRFIY
jgi:hypothetical protein